MNHSPIKLPITVARCQSARTKDCGQAANCAKALVAHDKARPVQDYSIEPRSMGVCEHYLPAEYFRSTADVAQRPAHEALKGML